MMQCFFLMLIIEEVIVYNFHKKYLDFFKIKSRKKTKKKHVIDIFDTDAMFIFISLLVVIIEEEIIYNFHKKKMHFCKKYLRNSPVQPLM